MPGLNPSYLEILNHGEDHPLLERMKSFAAENKIPIIQHDGMDLMLQLIIASKAKRVLEIGGAIGYFAISVGLETAASVISLEIDPDLAELAKINVSEAQLENRIEIMNCDALACDKNKLGTFDFLFIDAAKAQYIRLFEKYAPIVNQGGIIASDNLLFRGQVANPETIISRNRRQLVGKIRKYNDWLQQNPAYHTRFFEIGDGIAISVKK